MKIIKYLILSIGLLISTQISAADIHSHINNLIGENQKGWKEFKNKD